MAAPLLPRRAARSDRPTATFRAGIELPELRHAGEAGLARTGRGAQLGGHSTPLPPSLLLQSNAEDYQKFAGDASRKHVTVRAPATTAAAAAEPTMGGADLLPARANFVHLQHPWTHTRSLAALGVSSSSRGLADAPRRTQSGAAAAACRHMLSSACLGNPCSGPRC